MRRTSIFFAAVVMLITLATSVSAQTGRVLGARRVQLDDGSATLGGLVWLTDQGGSLGVDLNGNVSGSFPSTCALLDISSTTKGFLLPRMSGPPTPGGGQEFQICGGGPWPEGLMVYNLTSHTLDIFNGSSWGAISGWNLRGNTIALGGTGLGGSYIGTNNAQDFVIATNGVEQARVDATGRMAIDEGGANIISPTWALTVGTVGGQSTLNTGAERVNGLFTAVGGANIDNVAGALTTNIGNTANTGAVTIASNANPTAITLNVTSTANNLVLNNIATDVAPTQWLTLTNPGNQVRVTSLASIAEQGVSFVNEGGTSRFRLGDLTNAGEPLLANRFVNLTTFTLNFTGNVGGAGTNFVSFNGNNDAVGINNNAANTGATSIGNTTAGGAVSIGSAVAGPASGITLDVAAIANNLTLNNLNNGLNTDIGFVSLATGGINANSGNARLRSIGTIITGSQGVQVEYTGSSADAHFAKDNLSVLFTSTRFINTSNQQLNLTGSLGGAGTTYASFNGATNAITLNNGTQTGTTSIGNTTGGGIVSISTSGTGTSATAVNVLGPTNINTTGSQSRTTVGNGAGANTQLFVNGDGGGDVTGPAPYTNGPNNGWDLYVLGDAQATGIIKAGTASIIIDGSVSGANNIIGAWTNNLTLASNTNTKDMVFQTNNGAENTVLTAKSAGNLDIPVTAAGLGLGTISQNGTRFIHSFGTNDFFAGASAGNYTLTGISNTGVGSSALTSVTSGTQNNAFGAFALQNNQGGSGNNAFGYLALNSNTGGGNNVAIGGGAMQLNQTGTGNVAVGSNALVTNTASFSNVAVGSSALGTTTGGANTALGNVAGNTNATGSNNTFLGSGADANAGGYTFATAVGSNAIVGQNSSIILGRVGSDNVGIGTITPAVTLDVKGNTNINNNNTAIVNINTGTSTGATNINTSTTTATGLVTVGTSLAATSQQRLFVNGFVDAAVGNTLGGQPNVWDLVVTGDAWISGLLKANNMVASNLIPGQVVFPDASSQLVGDATFFWDNTANKRLDIGTSTTNVASGAASRLQVSANENPANGDAHQVIIAGLAGTSNEMLELGYNTTGNNGTIQSYNQTVGPTNLLINPAIAPAAVPGVGRTIVGNASAVPTTRLQVNGVISDLVGGPNFTSGPDNGWDLWDQGDAQIQGILKVGTSSIIIDGTSNPETITGYSNNLVLSAGTAAKDVILNTSGGNVATAKAAGNLDIPVTASPMGLGTISQNGNSLIHTYRGVTNFFAGTNAGNFTMGAGATTNTGVGNNALNALTTGNGNTAVGSGALLANSSGSNNTVLGDGGALSANTTGNGNTAIGTNALLANIGGEANVAVGNGALLSNTGGLGLVGSTAIGFRAGNTNTSGTLNTFVGNSASGAIATGSNNTLIGANSSSSGDFSNATAIGANATVGGNNMLVLGNTAAPTSVGIGINAPTAIFEVIGATKINNTGGATTSIASAATAIVNIGKTGGANNIAGLTKINDAVNDNTQINTGTGSGTVAIGSNTNTGGVTIASNFGAAAANNAIVLDISTTDANHNLAIKNLSADATPTQWLTINGSSQVRTTLIANTALEGIVWSGGAYRLGSTVAGNGAGSNPFLTNRNVNLDQYILNFTRGNNTSQLLTLDASATNAVTVNSSLNTINGATNINTTTYALTQVGSAGAGGTATNTQLSILGVPNNPQGGAPYTNGPNQGWDLYVNGDAQTTGITKFGTASIVVDPTPATMTGYGAVGLTIQTTPLGNGALTLQSIGSGAAVFQSTNGGNVQVHAAGGGNLTVDNATGALGISSTGAVNLTNSAGSTVDVHSSSAALSVTTTGGGNATFGTEPASTGIVTLQASGGNLNIKNTAGAGNGPIQVTVNNGNFTLNSTGTGVAAIGPNTGFGSAAPTATYPASTVHNSGSLSVKVNTQAGAYALTATDYLLISTNPGPGAVNVTLPAAVQGRVYVIKGTPAGGGDVRIQTTGGASIDGVPFNQVPAPLVIIGGGNTVRTLVCDGTNWFVIGN